MTWLDNMMRKKNMPVSENISFIPLIASVQVYMLLQPLHLFNGLFFRTTWVSQYQKCKTTIDLNVVRDDGVWGCSSISWTTCKQSVPHCIQITTPQHLVTQFLHPTNSAKALKASECAYY